MRKQHPRKKRPTAPKAVLRLPDLDQAESEVLNSLTSSSVIVNEAFVKRYLASRDPLGVYIGEGSGPDVKANIVIVGLCASFDYRDLRDDSAQAFFPMFEGDEGRINLPPSSFKDRRYLRKY